MSPLHQVQYLLSEDDTIDQILARTAKYKSSFYPHWFSKRSKIDPEIIFSPSATVFKTKLLSKSTTPKSIKESKARVKLLSCVRDSLSVFAAAVFAARFCFRLDFYFR